MLELRQIEEELQQIEWGDLDRDPSGWCPSCGRSREGYGGRHALGCSIRNIRDLLARVAEWQTQQTQNLPPSGA